jgi:hypothetical protein
MRDPEITRLLQRSNAAELHAQQTRELAEAIRERVEELHALLERHQETLRAPRAQ